MVKIGIAYVLWDRTAWALQYLKHEYVQLHQRPSPFLHSAVHHGVFLDERAAIERLHGPQRSASSQVRPLTRRQVSIRERTKGCYPNPDGKCVARPLSRLHEGLPDAGPTLKSPLRKAERSCVTILRTRQTCIGAAKCPIIVRPRGQQATINQSAGRKPSCERAWDQPPMRYLVPVSSRRIFHVELPIDTVPHGDCDPAGSDTARYSPQTQRKYHEAPLYCGSAADT
jgi:hypothetical protein